LPCPLHCTALHGAKRAERAERKWKGGQPLRTAAERESAHHPNRSVQHSTTRSECQSDGGNRERRRLRRRQNRARGARQQRGCGGCTSVQGAAFRRSQGRTGGSGRHPKDGPQNRASASGSTTHATTSEGGQCSGGAAVAWRWWRWARSAPARALRAAALIAADMTVAERGRRGGGERAGRCAALTHRMIDHLTSNERAKAKE
jgi:hypothetical protein